MSTGFGGGSGALPPSRPGRDSPGEFDQEERRRARSPGAGSLRLFPARRRAGIDDEGRADGHGGGDEDRGRAHAARLHRGTAGIGMGAEDGKDGDQQRPADEDSKRAPLAAEAGHEKAGGDQQERGGGAQKRERLGPRAYPRSVPAGAQRVAGPRAGRAGGTGESGHGQERQVQSSSNGSHSSSTSGRASARASAAWSSCVRIWVMRAPGKAPRTACTSGCAAACVFKVSNSAVSASVIGGEPPEETTETAQRLPVQRCSAAPSRWARSAGAPGAGSNSIRPGW